MDSHYDKVMKAREEAGTGTRQYFAYSTILDPAAFNEWKQQHSYGFFNLPEGVLAEAVDLKLVYDFNSRWWQGRVAGLADAPGELVHGRLFEVASSDWPIIQHKEGAVTGMCVERAVSVRVGGKRVDAVAFTTAPNRKSADGPVSENFIAALERGAQAAGLPQTWVSSLRGQAK